MADEVKSNDVIEKNETNDVTDESGAKKLIKAVVEEAKTQKELTETEQILANATPDERKEIEAEKKQAKLDAEAKSEKPDDKVVDDENKVVSDSGVKEDLDSKKVEDDKTSTKLDEMNLPGRLLQAASRNHLTDEEIISLGDRAVPVLSKLADTLDGASQALGEAGRKYRELLKSKGVNKEDKKSTPITFTPEEIEQNPVLSKVQKILEENQQEIVNLRTSLQNKEVDSSKITAAQQKVQIDKFFDDVSEVFTELGTSQNLTQAQKVLRDCILDDADNIMIGATLNGDEKSLDEALGMALSIYEGKNPKKVEKIRQNIVDDVIKREGQHINRPSGKKSTSNLQTDHEKAVAAAAKVLREHGRDVV